MSVADYVDRAALAATHALRGLGADEFVSRLERSPVEIACGPKTFATHEGRSALDLSVRLLARLYPGVELRAPVNNETVSFVELAQRVNPHIDTVVDAPALSLVIGDDAIAPRAEPVYIGSDGGAGLLSTRSAQTLGASDFSTGAGAAACIGAARMFRRLFGGAEGHETDVRLDLVDLLAPGVTLAAPIDFGTVVLAGAGAIGEAVLWSLYRSPASGRVHVVDDEALDLSNLQRYVLAERSEVGERKVELVRRRALDARIDVESSDERWQTFMATNGTTWQRILAALDTIDQRRELQATLPRWFGNAWTQIGDLGVSTHIFGTGPCAWCLYLPDRELPSEDQLVAEGLRLPYEDVKAQVRELLYTGAPVPDAFLERVATALTVERAAVEPFKGQPLRKLYQLGVCGGALIRAGDGAVGRDTQVPLAHQSALAGVALAAALLIDAAGMTRATTDVLRIDVMRPLAGLQLIRPQARDTSGRCICADMDYTRTYEEKYPNAAAANGSTAR